MTEELARSRFAAEIRGLELLTEYCGCTWQTGFKVLYVEDGFFGCDILRGEKRDDHYFSYGAMRVDRFKEMMWECYGLGTRVYNWILLHITDELLECLVHVKESERTEQDGWIGDHYYSKVLCTGDIWEIDSAHYVRMCEMAGAKYEWKLVDGDYQGERSYSLELLELCYRRALRKTEKAERAYRIVREKMGCLGI